jgi:hypothetical protein
MATPPTLAQRYGFVVTWAIMGDLLLFFLSSTLIIGFVNGSAPWWAWAVALVTELFSLFFGFWLGVLYFHDRELIHKREGELA